MRGSRTWHLVDLIRKLECNDVVVNDVYVLEKKKKKKKKNNCNFIELIEHNVSNTYFFNQNRIKNTQAHL